MGFNIAGIAINRNYRGREKELQEKLGIDLEFVEAITLEEASRNWKDEGLFDICFVGNATIIFTNHNDCHEAYMMEEDNVLTFAIAEVSDAYLFAYSENAVEKRSYMSVDGMVTEDGEPIFAEGNEEEPTDIVLKTIDDMIGSPFFDFDLSEKAYRYRRKDKSAETIESSQSKKSLDNQNESELSDITTSEETEIDFEKEQKRLLKSIIISLAVAIYFFFIDSHKTTISYIVGITSAFFFANSTYTYFRLKKAIKLGISDPSYIRGNTRRLIISIVFLILYASFSVAFLLLHTILSYIFAAIFFLLFIFCLPEFVNRVRRVFKK